MREYNVRREIEDEDVSEDEFSTEDDSDSETLNDDSDLEFDFAEADISERSKVEAFIREACGCTLAETGKPCSSTITKEEFIDCRNNCTELTPTELDMVLLGTIHSSDMSISGRKETIRKRIRTPFFLPRKTNLSPNVLVSTLYSATKILQPVETL